MRARTPRMVTYVIWVLLLALALGQPATNAKAPAMAPSEVLGVHAATDNQALQGKVYVALGDSISSGRYATAQDDIFPALVAEKLGMTDRPNWAVRALAEMVTTLESGLV